MSKMQLHMGSSNVSLQLFLKALAYSPTCFHERALSIYNPLWIQGKCKPYVSFSFILYSSKCFCKAISMSVEIFITDFLRNTEFCFANHRGRE